MVEALRSALIVIKLYGLLYICRVWSIGQIHSQGPTKTPYSGGETAPHFCIVYCRIVGHRGNSKAMLTYSQFSGRINGVLENILLSIPKTFTSAQFMAAVKTFLPDECAQILSRTTIRGLHVWMARWYLNGNQTITKAGVKTIETVNGNKSTNALWNNPLK